MWLVLVRKEELLCYTWGKILFSHPVLFFIQNIALIASLRDELAAMGTRRCHPAGHFTGPYCLVRPRSNFGRSTQIRFYSHIRSQEVVRSGAFVLNGTKPPKSYDTHAATHGRWELGDVKSSRG